MNKLGYGLWQSIDIAVIDNLGPNGIASSAQRTASGFSRIQSGYIFHYALAMFVGITLLATWYAYFF
jgi:NADH-quinone oxidoreductase subunit L